ncbi:MAG TPA: flp pilus-assembly TadE/G-like family protein [Arachnia sp.]|nr:flp pilus-assembly TadE/G-like family protein [Arachnia sp.]HMT86652.1 flp pilus-assembly TadE/G-like family protein [Arachnia sp.]
MSRAERGAGSVLVAGVCAALAATLFASAILIGWFAQSRRAELTAELAAVAGVGAAVEGADACAAARRVADANGGSLASCRVLGLSPDVVVATEVVARLHPALPLGGPDEVRRAATAGTR